ncbi:MAG TPA: outer membrane lipoprotein carrier protein LolA [Taishania sp.]|nr:outer membrane lipoprotein carrier protein LolA [Taishania sp.]
MRLFFVFLMLLTFSVSAQEFKTVVDKGAVKSAIEKKHKETSSITADFSEKIYSDMFKDAQIGKGKFYFKKDQKVRWENTTAQQLILISGDKVKLFEKGRLNANPTSQKVVKQIQGMMISMLSGDFLNEKDFSINYLENATNYKLILTPKTPRMSKYISKIELLFDKKSCLLDELGMFESKNQKIIYTFTNLKINQSIADTKFTEQ